MSRPSLHEIAAMPHSEAQLAVRKYYDPKWGSESASDEPATWQVSLRAYHSGYVTETFEVTALNADDAEKVALERFSKSTIWVDGRDCEVENVQVSA